MVNGLEYFLSHFSGFESHFILIGGTACDLWMGSVGLPFRATKDLDIVLIADSLPTEYLGVKEDYVRQLIAYGHLTAVNVGGTGRENRYRISEKELYAFVERSRNEPKSRRAARLRGSDFLDNFDEQHAVVQEPDG
jgi:excisionase family DNA binding protein